MWNVKRKEDGQCVGNDYALFRYPVGILPGNVIPQKEEPLYEPGTILFRIFEQLLPVIMGGLVILFFLCTTLYMGFSLLRLFYSDTLKPYKTRSLKALGKHHHHYRRRESGSAVSASELTPAPSVHLSNQGISRRSLKGDLVDEGAGKKLYAVGYNNASMARKSKPLLALDSKISLTSPPHRTRTYAFDHKPIYPHVLDMIKPTDVSEPPKIPASNKNELRDRERASLDEGPTKRKKPDGWVWDPNWYQRQVQDEKETARALLALRAAQSLIHVKVRPGIPQSSTSLPNLSSSPSVKKILPTGWALVKEKKPLRKRKRSEGDGEQKQVVAVVQAESPPIKPPSSPRPATPSTPASRPATKDRPITPSELSKRYTFKHETGPKLHTAIPKVQKKTWNAQLMILRGGPRRTAEEIRKQKRIRQRSAGQFRGCTEVPQEHGDGQEDFSKKTQFRLESEK